VSISAQALAAGSDAILARLVALHPKIIDLSLDRIERILAALGHPEARLPPAIHVAGTNGKGSTLAMLRAGLEARGARVHVYTSPHLARFHERIRLAGELVSEPELERLLARCEATNGGAPITFFEITTAAAFLAMAEIPADWALLEVGLGGRLDATNVVARPALTIITPVDLDHEQYLGDTIAKIAFEKAGILKPGVPCIVGPQKDEGLAVIAARAEALGAKLLVWGQDFITRTEHGRLVYEDADGLLDLSSPNLVGQHQVENAGAAIQALRLLGKGDPEAAITRAEWPARMQRLRRGPIPAAAPFAEIWLDGGHNPHAGLAVAAALAGLAPRPTFLVCGMLETKDARGFLRPLAPHANRLYGVAIPEAAASLPAAATVEAAQEAGLAAEPAPSVLDAVRRIASEDPMARILICGSLYLAGSVLKENG
jgi:dihydrofolate synthase / folylpolyglutamate synthase